MPLSLVRPANPRNGFTLIEVLIALSILAIALMAAMRAAGQGTTNVAEMRSRVLAGWVAENLLATQRARGEWLPLGEQNGVATQAGMEFIWREKIIATPNAAFRRVDVQVFPAADDSHSLARFTSYITHPPQPPQPPQ